MDNSKPSKRKTPPSSPPKEEGTPPQESKEIPLDTPHGPLGSVKASYKAAIDQGGKFIPQEFSTATEKDKELILDIVVQYALASLSVGGDFKNAIWTALNSQKLYQDKTKQ